MPENETTRHILSDYAHRAAIRRTVSGVLRHATRYLPSDSKRACKHIGARELGHARGVATEMMLVSIPKIASNANVIETTRQHRALTALTRIGQ